MTPEQEHDDQDALISTLEQRALELVGLLPPKEETGAKRRLRGLHFGHYLHSGVPARSVGRQSPFNTWARICSKRWAPRSLQRICCFFTNRLLTTWLTADSANPVEMVFPCRYRSP